MSEIQFTVLGKAAPQGSLKAFVIAGRARLTSDNKKTMPYRQQVGWAALGALEGREQPFAAKHIPVRLALRFYFRKPDSVSKKRFGCVVKPDLDKLIRSTCDAMTGIIWHDDAQITCVTADKAYDAVERVEICVSIVGAS